MSEYLGLDTNKKGCRKVRQPFCYWFPFYFDDGTYTHDWSPLRLLKLQKCHQKNVFTIESVMIMRLFVLFSWQM